METITLREYENIPIIYDEAFIDDENTPFASPKLEVGDYFKLRESQADIDIGSVVSVYEVIRLTKTGYESKVTMLKVT